MSKPRLTAGLLVVVAMVAGAPAVSAATGASTGRIAFSTDNSGEPQIYTVNPNGTGETQLTFDTDGHASAPTWSPDGQRIAFVGDATGE
jgi:hypothetical protein